MIEEIFWSSNPRYGSMKKEDTEECHKGIPEVHPNFILFLVSGIKGKASEYISNRRCPKPVA